MMQTPARTIVIAVLGVAALCAAARGEDGPGTEVPPVTPDELETARETVGGYPPAQQMLLNALRFLMRTGYETEMFFARPHRPCALAPFDADERGGLSTLEQLRLWAVLQAGFPETPALEQQVERFLDTDEPGTDAGLAPHAVGLSICAAILQREGLARERAVLRLAGDILDAGESRELDVLTGEDSPYLSDDGIDPRWYANVMWRTVVVRRALQLGLKPDTQVLRRDLEALFSQRNDDGGWPVRDAAADIDLVAITAVGLAADMPQRALGDSFHETVAGFAESARGLIGALDERPCVTREALFQSLPAGFRAPGAPGPDETAGWFPRGAVLSPWTLSATLEAGGPLHSTPQREVADTALACLAVSGGLLGGKDAPLSGRGVRDIAAAMRAFSVLEMHEGLEEFRVATPGPRVRHAVERACLYLESVQKQDGSFPGQYEKFRGHTAMCVLALLQGGRGIDAPSVRKGMSFVLEYETPPLPRVDGPGFTSHEMLYCDAITLMLLERYVREENTRPGAAHVKAAKQCLADIKNSKNTGRHGGWAYFPADSNLKGRAGDYYDNSCSHFAVLGYGAGGALGLDYDAESLKEEAERLIDTFDTDRRQGKVKYVQVRDGVARTHDVRPGGWAYRPPGMDKRNMQMTGAGMASLAIIRDRLKARGELGPELERRIGMRIRGAEAWLAANYYEIDPRGRKNELNRDLEFCFSDGYGAYFNLYAVGRAATLTGLHLLDGRVDWYAVGAQQLLAYQQPDGAWRSKLQTPFPEPHEDQVVNTSMAILFLTYATLPLETAPNPGAPAAPREPLPHAPSKPDSPVTPGPGDDD